MNLNSEIKHGRSSRGNSISRSARFQDPGGGGGASPSPPPPAAQSVLSQEEEMRKRVQTAEAAGRKGRGGRSHSAMSLDGGACPHEFISQDVFID